MPRWCTAPDVLLDRQQIPLPGEGGHTSYWPGPEVQETVTARLKYRALRCALVDDISRSDTYPCRVRDGGVSMESQATVSKVSGSALLPDESWHDRGGNGDDRPRFRQPIARELPDGYALELVNNELQMEEPSADVGHHHPTARPRPRVVSATPFGFPGSDGSRRRQPPLGVAGRPAVRDKPVDAKLAVTVTALPVSPPPRSRSRQIARPAPDPDRRLGCPEPTARGSPHRGSCHEGDHPCRPGAEEWAGCPSRSKHPSGANAMPRRWITRGLGSPCWHVESAPG